MQESGNLSFRRAGSVQQATTSLTLLERGKQREAEGWRRLVRLYQPLITWWCRRKGLPEQDAERRGPRVVTVNARVAEFSKGEQRGSFRGWLHRITDHKVGDYRRKQEKAPRAPGGSEAQHLLQQVPDSSVGSGIADDGSEVIKRSLPQSKRDPRWSVWPWLKVEKLSEAHTVFSPLPAQPRQPRWPRSVFSTTRRCAVLAQDMAKAASPA